MTATATRPRQEAKKARRQARNLLRHADAITPELVTTIRDLREYAVHSEPRHRMTADHALRCNAYEPFSADEAR